MFSVFTVKNRVEIFVCWQAGGEITTDALNERIKVNEVIAVKEENTAQGVSVYEITQSIMGGVTETGRRRPADGGTSQAPPT